jgi:hypothetical protein
MQVLGKHSTPFFGNTSAGGKYAELLVTDPRCTRCGSSLATRREKTYVSQSLTNGRTFHVEVFKCRCHRVRRIRRPLEVAV